MDRALASGAKRESSILFGCIVNHIHKNRGIAMDVDEILEKIIELWCQRFFK